MQKYHAQWAIVETAAYQNLTNLEVLAFAVGQKM
jgi:hypothetical protein